MNHIYVPLNQLILVLVTLFVGLLFGFAEPADAQLAEIEVNPSDAVMNVGDPPVTFTATAKNAGGETVTIPFPLWQVNGGGTIVPNGQTCTFTATTAGNFYISCRDVDSDLSDYSSISISDTPALASIDITPANVSIKVGDPPVTFTATGKDAGGETVSILSPIWEANGGGTIAPSGQSCTFTATTAGTFQITCREGDSGISGSAGLIISVPPALASIDITPANVSIKVGDPPVTFTATGKDAGGETVSIPSPIWEATGGGTIVPSGQSCTFTATTAGTFQITCREGDSGVSGSAGLIISVPPALASIDITPANVSIKVGDPPVTFTATGKDAGGETVTIPFPLWEVNGGGTIVPNGQTCTFTATTPGGYTIACEKVGTGIQGTATINIYEILLGDVNCDGSNTPGDALCTFWRAILGSFQEECACDGSEQAADVNCDGAVTPGDALCIFWYSILGEWPEECECEP